MTDLRQTKEWARWLLSTGWGVDWIGTGRKKTSVFIRKIPGLPISFFKVQRFEEKIDWKQFNLLKKKYHVFWSVLEPITKNQVKDLVEHGYRPMRDTYLPGKTRVIDLTKSEATLLSEMSENFRRIINRNGALKVRRISSDEFFEGWKKWSKSMVLTSDQFKKMVEVFGKKVEFWAGQKNNQLLSAVMLLLTDDSCFYYQTWTSEEGRKHSQHVGLVWETIRRAKKSGKTFYNFEGVFDKRFPMARWGGFSEFKRRFGGYEIEYPGSFQKWC